MAISVILPSLITSVSSYAQSDVISTTLSAEKPNVIYLFTDDQRADTVGALGNKDIITPNIDRIANQGFIFNNAYNFGGNHAAVCIPARNMTMTGNTHFRFKGKMRDDGTGITFPKQMKSLGYETWYLEKSGTANLPHIRTQFDHYEDIDMISVLASGHPAKDAITKAINFIDKERDDNKPFFMYLGFPAPHDPRWAAQEYRDLYKQQDMKLPNNYQPVHKYDMGMMTVRDERLEKWPRTKEAIKRHIYDYYSIVSAIDKDIGRLLDYLERTGLDKNTIIVFSSDQGIALGSHGLMGKQNLYEATQKVPLFISGPNISKGQSDAFVYHHDILPTIVDMVSGNKLPTIDGKSFKPIIEGKIAKVRNNIVLAYEKSQRTIRVGDFKLYQLPLINITMLFNLATDPDEIANLADKAEYESKVIELLYQLRIEQEKLGDKQPLFSKKPNKAEFIAPTKKLLTPYEAGGLAPGKAPAMNADFIKERNNKAKK